MQTPTGWDLYAVRGGNVKVTANYAAAEGRVSVKLTVNRGPLGEHTYLYDKMEKTHRSESEALLAGRVIWLRRATKSESKIQVNQDIDAFSSDTERFRWVEKQATVLKSWADEIAR